MPDSLRSHHEAVYSIPSGQTAGPVIYRAQRSNMASNNSKIMFVIPCVLSAVAIGLAVEARVTARREIDLNKRAFEAQNRAIEAREREIVQQIWAEAEPVVLEYRLKVEKPPTNAAELTNLLCGLFLGVRSK
jgi:hypothetical protein